MHAPETNSWGVRKMRALKMACTTGSEKGTECARREKPSPNICGERGRAGESANQRPISDQSTDHAATDQQSTDQRPISE